MDRKSVNLLGRVVEMSFLDEGFDVEDDGEFAAVIVLIDAEVWVVEFFEGGELDGGGCELVQVGREGDNTGRGCVGKMRSLADERQEAVYEKKVTQDVDLKREGLGSDSGVKRNISLRRRCARCRLRQDRKH